MSKILDLINAMASGNAADAQDTFTSVMFDKISDRLDTMKQDMAQGMFSEKNVVTEDLDIEDYSIEDLEEFMVSEEFNQLDEISGKMLGSYIQKARADGKAKFDHGRELDKDPKVAAIKAKVSDWYDDRKYKKDGSSVHREKINKARVDIETRKKKIDPNYPKSANDNKRHRGVETAIKKLHYGKLTNEDLDEASIKTSVPSHSYSHVMKKIKSGDWESQNDVIPGRHTSIIDNSGGKKKIKMIHVKEELDLDTTEADVQDILESSQLDELSKKTLGSYIKKATTDHGIRRDQYARGVPGKNNYASVIKTSKRKSFIDLAADKLTKEGNE